ncbi:hypothetical protein EVAR_52352_1 [Eumeta japonica]|uniref:Uncharacterized protein n=1 Tax=Eumeta variegata TaxID=151549 RepID=A0A4C1YQ70_EUMVA|nr:hypothetical protein EVAR_52352_1 [Eumeta japonica]
MRANEASRPFHLAWADRVLVGYRNRDASTMRTCEGTPTGGVLLCIRNSEKWLKGELRRSRNSDYDQPLIISTERSQRRSCQIERTPVLLLDNTAA